MPLIRRLQYQVTFRATQRAIWRTLLCFSPFALAMLFTISAPRAAQYEVVGAYGQQQSFVATHDHYAYVAGGCNLRVLNLADPAHPKPVGYLRLEKEVTQVLMKWPALYVAQARGAGMWVVDLTDPRHPRPHGEAIFKSDNATSRVEPSFRGSYLVLENHAKGEKLEVTIYGLGAPLEPVKLDSGTYGYDYPPFDFFISGSHLFTAHRGKEKNGTARELLIEDRSTTPSKILARYPVSEEGEPHSAELNYDRVTGQLSWGEGGTKLNLGTFKTTETAPRLVFDPTAHADRITTTPLANWQQSLPIGTLKVADRIAYASSGSRLAILNCRQPENPALMTSCTLPAEITAFSVEDRAIYAATSAGRLEIFDTKNLTAPQPAGSLAITSPTVCIASSEKRLYLLSPQGGLDIYDLPEWNKPVLAGNFKPQYACTDLATSGSQLFLFGNESVTIIDIRDIKQPRQVGQLMLQWPKDIHLEVPAKFKRAGGYLYAVYYDTSGYENNGYTLAIDVSDPARPAQVKEYESAEAHLGTKGIQGLPAYQGYMLARPFYWHHTFGTGMGYSIYDLANPRLRVLLDQLETDDLMGQVAIGRNLLYLPTNDGMIILRRRK